MCIVSRYEGYCPQTKANQYIQIDFLETSCANQLTPTYKKMNFDCPDIAICKYLDSYGRCPLYIDAPDHP